jgi:hypothetical protein
MDGTFRGPAGLLDWFNWMSPTLTIAQQVMGTLTYSVPSPSLKVNQGFTPVRSPRESELELVVVGGARSCIKTHDEASNKSVSNNALVTVAPQARVLLHACKAFISLEPQWISRM